MGVRHKTLGTKEYQALTLDEQKSCYYENGELKVIPVEQRRQYLPKGTHRGTLPV